MSANAGLTPAKKCVGRLIEVSDSNNNRFDRFDPFYLYWSRQSEEDVFIEPTWFTISCPIDLSAQNPPNIERRDEYLRRKK
jgi:hypothetical protein